MYFHRIATFDDNFEEIAKFLVENDNSSRKKLYESLECESGIAETLAKLMEMENNHFSYRNFHLCYDEFYNLLGVGIAFRPEKIDNIKSYNEYKKFFKLSREKYHMLVRALLPMENKGSAYYVYFIKVRDGYEPKKVGVFLMDKIKELSKKDNFQFLYTDVNMGDEYFINNLKEDNFNPVRVLNLGLNEKDALYVRMMCKI